MLSVSRYLIKFCDPMGLQAMAGEGLTISQVFFATCRSMPRAENPPWDP